MRFKAFTVHIRDSVTARTFRPTTITRASGRPIFVVILVADGNPARNPRLAPVVTLCAVVGSGIPADATMTTDAIERTLQRGFDAFPANAAQALQGEGL